MPDKKMEELAAQLAALLSSKKLFDVKRSDVTLSVLMDDIHILDYTLTYEDLEFGVESLAADVIGNVEAFLDASKNKDLSPDVNKWLRLMQTYRNMERIKARQ